MDGYLKNKKGTQDMLKKGSNFYIIGLLLPLLHSCGETPNKSDQYLKTNFESYKEIHITITDSVNVYLDSLLATFTTEYMFGWSIDSLICINSTKDKLFAVSMDKKGSCTGCLTDNAMQVMGKKINGKWYFFKGGGSLTIPRDMYGKDGMHPLTFYELSQIARKNMLESSLIKKDGEYVVDDEWIDKKFYNTGYGLNLSRAQYDSIHWMLIMRKWTEKIDTNEYKPLKKADSHKPNS